jgi:hypothetical protein
MIIFKFYFECPNPCSMKLNTIVLILLTLFSFGYCITNPQSRNIGQNADPLISFIRHESDKKIDVLINKQLFTSYCWEENIFKPVLFPIFSAGGHPITRGYPIAPRPGERVDHPHQVGLWLNYGDVQGYDFWNNSLEIPAGKKKDYGSIIHHETEAMKSGRGEGVLITNESWIDPNGKELLSEKTAFHFLANDEFRIIDRVTTLKSTGSAVLFKDNKEGMLGLRVARQLELPSKEELILMDAKGNPTKVAKMTNDGVTGNYLSSEGLTGDSVWGKRARWMELSGKIEQEKISLLIFDHPKNPGYPTFWHARGYGLFAANPLGWNVFTNGKESFNFNIQSGQSTTFRYRILIHSGDLTAEQINGLAEDFVKRY